MCVLGFGAAAQTSIRVEAPNLVSVDEQFNITFSIDGEHSVSDFSWPGSEDFKTVWGPQKSSSTSVSIVNGKRSKTVTASYTYVLMPVKAGSFSVPAATAKVQGRTISSGPARIEVVAGGQPQASSGSRSQGQSQGAGTSGSIPDSDIYMRLLVNKTRAVVGETVTATLKLYQRVNIAGFEDVKFPSFNGFWSQEMAAPSNIEFRRENVGGEIFNTAVLRSWNLIPQKSGDIVIDPSELVCKVNVRTASSSSGSIFDDFFQESYRTVRKRVVTQPVTMHVSALPTGAPASFGGGVGKFEMSASLTRDSLKAHDAASLKVSISGTGNISLLEAPKINFPPDFEQYDVKASDNGRTRVFEYPFIPRSHGEFEIGPVEYSYYDVQAGRYVTLSSGPMHLSVARGADLGTGAAPVSGGQLVQPARKDVKDLGSDIRYISTRKPAFRESGKTFLFSGAYFATALLLCLLALAAAFVMRGILRRKADVAGTRNRGASKMARKRLSLANGYLSKKLYTAFYEELHRALLGFVSDKLNMDAADMNKENISARFAEAGADEGSSSELTSLLDACEYARYSPDSGYEAMNTHYEKAVEVIAAIDSAMKKTPRKAAGAAALALLLMILPIQGHAADVYADSLWNAGVEAYSQGHWQEAGDAWTQIASLGMGSAELYCNIGDALFRQNELAGAVLYYSRALKLDPSFKDARYNLEFVETRLQDNIEAVPEFFLKGIFRKLCYALSSDAWALVSLFCLAGLLAMVLLYVLGRSSASRRWGFFAGLALALCLLVSVLCGARQRHDSRLRDSAVIMRPVVSVKSAPGGSDNKDLFILHEGTTVRLLDEVGGWSNIRLADGREGWLRSEYMTVI